MDCLNEAQTKDDVVEPIDEVWALPWQRGDGVYKQMSVPNGPINEDSTMNGVLNKRRNIRHHRRLMVATHRQRQYAIHLSTISKRFVHSVTMSVYGFSIAKPVLLPMFS